MAIDISAPMPPEEERIIGVNPHTVTHAHHIHGDECEQSACKELAVSWTCSYGHGGRPSAATPTKRWCVGKSHALSHDPILKTKHYFALKVRVSHGFPTGFSKNGPKYGSIPPPVPRKSCRAGCRWPHPGERGSRGPLLTKGDYVEALAS